MSERTGTDEQTLGVLGGMGPEATIHFLDELVRVTPAQRDQDHIETVVYNDPKVPDRNDAILNDGESPLPRLIRNARQLEEIGAEIVALPCNTAHHYYEEITEVIDVELIHMIEEVCSRVEDSGIENVGLLSTSTVLKVGVYDEVFGEADVELTPPKDINEVMKVIYSIKQGETERAQECFDAIVDEMVGSGVDALVIGCTDLSVLETRGIESIDATTVLAESCVERIRS